MGGGRTVLNVNMARVAGSRAPVKSLCLTVGLAQGACIVLHTVDKSLCEDRNWFMVAKMKRDHGGWSGILTAIQLMFCNNHATNVLTEFF